MTVIAVGDETPLPFNLSRFLLSTNFGMLTFVFDVWCSIIIIIII